jgi:CBS-domain-containing membrane protein
VTGRRVGVVAAGAGAIAVAGILLGAGPGAAAPLAATLALVVATPAVPAARPRAVLGGYALSTLAGLLVTAGVGAAAPEATGVWWTATAAVAVATGLAVALMTRFDALHPPAAAAACVVALQPLLHWPVALIVLAGGAAVACAAALRARRSPADGRSPHRNVRLPVVDQHQSVHGSVPGRQ